MENYCHRKLASQSLVELYTWTDNRFLLQPTLSLSINQAQPYNAYYRAISLDNYPIVALQLLIWIQHVNF